MGWSCEDWSQGAMPHKKEVKDPECMRICSSGDNQSPSMKLGSGSNLFIVFSNHTWHWITFKEPNCFSSCSIPGLPNHCALSQTYLVFSLSCPPPVNCTVSLLSIFALTTTHTQLHTFLFTNSCMICHCPSILHNILLLHSASPSPHILCPIRSSKPVNHFYPLSGVTWALYCYHLIAVSADHSQPQESALATIPFYLTLTHHSLT